MSILRWRSTFQIFGNGVKGYWRLSGRDRSYGNQKYIVGKRWGWLAGKKQKLTEKMVSNSKEKNIFLNEMTSILKKIRNSKVDQFPCNELEVLKTMKLIDDLYAY